MWKGDGDSELNPSSRQRREHLILTTGFFGGHWQISPFPVSQLIKNRHCSRSASSGYGKSGSAGVKPLGTDGQIPKCHIFVCPDGRAAPGALGAVWWEAEQAAPPQPDVVVAGVA